MYSYSEPYGAQRVVWVAQSSMGNEQVKIQVLVQTNDPPMDFVHAETSDNPVPLEKAKPITSRT